MPFDSERVPYSERKKEIQEIEFKENYSVKKPRSNKEFSLPKKKKKKKKKCDIPGFCLHILCVVLSYLGPIYFAEFGCNFDFFLKILFVLLCELLLFVPNAEAETDRARVGS